MATDNSKRFFCKYNTTSSPSLKINRARNQTQSRIKILNMASFSDLFGGHLEIWRIVSKYGNANCPVYLPAILHGMKVSANRGRKLCFHIKVEIQIEVTGNEN